MDGGYYWDDPPSTPWYILSERYIGIYNLWIGRPCHESYPRTLNSFQVSWVILHISYSIFFALCDIFRSWIVNNHKAYFPVIHPPKNHRISKNHTHTHTRMIYRGKYVGEPMWTTTLALGKFREINVPASTHPTLGPIRIRKRSAISGFGFSGLDRIVNIPTYARASWGSWEKRRKGRVRVSMKFLHHWKGQLNRGRSWEDL